MQTTSIVTYKGQTRIDNRCINIPESNPNYVFPSSTSFLAGVAVENMRADQNLYNLVQGTVTGSGNVGLIRPYPFAKGNPVYVDLDVAVARPGFTGVAMAWNYPPNSPNWLPSIQTPPNYKLTQGWCTAQCVKRDDNVFDLFCSRGCDKNGEYGCWTDEIVWDSMTRLATYFSLDPSELSLIRTGSPDVLQLSTNRFQNSQVDIFIRPNADEGNVEDVDDVSSGFGCPTLVNYTAQLDADDLSTEIAVDIFLDDRCPTAGLLQNIVEFVANSGISQADVGSVSWSLPNQTCTAQSSYLDSCEIKLVVQLNGVRSAYVAIPLLVDGDMPYTWEILLNVTDSNDVVDTVGETDYGFSSCSGIFCNDNSFNPFALALGLPLSFAALFILILCCAPEIVGCASSTASSAVGGWRRMKVK